MTRNARLRVRIKGTSKVVSLVLPRSPIEKMISDHLVILLRDGKGASGHFVCAWDEDGWSSAGWEIGNHEPAFVSGIVNGHLAILAAKKVINEEAQRYE